MPSEHFGGEMFEGDFAVTCGNFYFAHVDGETSDRAKLVQKGGVRTLNGVCGI